MVASRMTATISTKILSKILGMIRQNISLNIMVSELKVVRSSPVLYWEMVALSKVISL